jgi:hypothetical protein
MSELRRMEFKGLIAFEYEKEGEINDEVRLQPEFARTLI